MYILPLSQTLPLRQTETALLLLVVESQGWISEKEKIILTKQERFKWKKASDKKITKLQTLHRNVNFTHSAWHIEKQNHSSVRKKSMNKIPTEA